MHICMSKAQIVVAVEVIALLFYSQKQPRGLSRAFTRSISLSHFNRAFTTPSLTRV